MDDSKIEFVRLSDVPLSLVSALLNEPRNSRHMPLAAAFSEDAAAEWVAAKDRQWTTNGYGPWAILLDGRFAGWGGFERQSAGADFALVLSPVWWGSGPAIARAALSQGFDELGLEDVVIALPFTRHPTRVVARWGFVPDGQVDYGGVSFRRYRLTRERWLGLVVTDR